MAEDVKLEVIKKTQDILGNYIKKPILTEKLLKKPPFRFLYDICLAAMKETGFFEGVLNGPDLKIENIKDKEGKIAFLQKVIGAVEAANGIKLSVKPNKVVAGLEATKTNEFLQALGKALEKQQSESKVSKSSQPTKTKSTKKPSKEVKEEPPDKKKNSSRSSKKIVENGVPHETVDEVKNRSDVDRTPRSPKKKNSSKKLEETSSKSETNFHDDKPKEKNLNNGLVDKTSPEKNQINGPREKSDVRGAGESTDLPNDEVIKVTGSNGKGDQNQKAKEEVVQDGDLLRRGHSGKPKHRRSSLHSGGDSMKVIEATENNENESDISRKVDSIEDKISREKNNLVDRPESVLREQNRTTPSPQSNSSKKDTNLVREGTIISRPRTGIRPTTARPAGARPAAPRIRDRGEVAVAEEIIKQATGKVQVIEDKETNNEAEEETLISLETPNDILLEEPSPILPPTTTTTTTTEQGEHGHLVEQILEAQRELEDDSRLPFSDQKSTGKTEIEWESGRSRESTNREIEKLRSSIQTLTRSANPLGKLLDFFQEDIDIIQKELEQWREKNSSLSVQIAHEKSITDQHVEPLKIHLKELQQNIDQQIDQINIVKANIIRNNQKIHKLLAGLQPVSQSLS